jgi:hypothetical protein
MEIAVSAVLTEGTLEKAAKKASVSLATIKRWMREPAFKRALRDARLGILERIGDVYLQLAKRATKVVYDCMKDDNPPGIRLRAVATANDSVKEIVGLVSVKAELDELRALVEAKGHAEGTLPSRNGATAGRDHERGR